MQLLQLDNGIDGKNDEFDKIVITNLSPTDQIAVLVENEESEEDRTKLLKKLIENDEKQNDDLLFITNGYQVIPAATELGSESVKFIKTWDYTFVTVTNITDKEIVCDRKCYLEDYLYFEDDDLQRISQYKPKCKNKNGKQHKLKEVNSKKNNNKFDCVNCKSKELNIYYHCYKCQYTLCQGCCHLKICFEKVKQRYEG